MRRIRKSFLMILIIISTQLFTLLAAFPCSTFLMSDNNNAVFGKSYDWHMGQAYLYVNKRGVKKHAIVTGEVSSTSEVTILVPQSPAKWTSSYGSITFNQFGREFPNGGMNEKGLVVEIMVLEGSKFPLSVERGESINELQWIQYQLDNFSSVAQMIEKSKKLNILPMYGKDGKVHFLACDRSRACATFEYLNRKWKITSGKKLKVKALTNSTYAESVKNLSEYTGFGGERAIPTNEESISRFIRASYMAMQFPTSTSTLSLAINYGFQILGSVAMSHNKWQILYDLDNLGVYFKTSTNTGNKVKFVDFNEFNLSCKTPVMAFDIESTREGNVTSIFSPYNQNDNYKLVRTSLANMPPLSVPDALNTVTNLPQIFECL
ncbi:MAG: linear amide C-N hydrolase [Oligoflexia bacterium]|nr:linear amide C-N hydrolase [Oligoflexia bacterium]